MKQITEITDDVLNVANLGRALVNGKTLQFFNIDTKEWEDTNLHTVNEMLLFISYGIIYRIKP